MKPYIFLFFLFIKTTIFIISLIEKNFCIFHFIFLISLLFCSINMGISKIYGGTPQEKFCKIGGLLILAGSLFLRKILKIARAPIFRVPLNDYFRVCVCVFISFHRRGFSWLKQSNKCNAKDQANDVVLRKSLCVKYFHHHITANHL